MDIVNIPSTTILRADPALLSSYLAFNIRTCEHARVGLGQYKLLETACFLAYPVAEFREYFVRLALEGSGTSFDDFAQKGLIEIGNGFVPKAIRCFCLRGNPCLQLFRAYGFLASANRNVRDPPL